MRIKVSEALYHKSARGSLTVEAAIIVPITLFCILWMVQGGISLYMATVEIVQRQEMWEDFHPAAQFRRLELLEEAIDTMKQKSVEEKTWR